MTDTPHLALPRIAAAQAQKHVTHNEALAMLDALVQLSVLSRTATAPPPGTTEGARYLVPVSAGGAFAGKTNQIAQFDGGAWRFLAPKPGWVAHVADEGLMLVFDGAGWKSLSETIGPINQLMALGIGTQSDAVNRLAVSGQGALMTARRIAAGGTGDMRLSIEKEAAARTASLLFQTGFSGRAEIGITANDDLRVKVSTDGAIWRDAITVNGTNGQVSFPNGVSGVSGGQASALGQCRLDLSGGNLRLRPLNGNLLTVNGAAAIVPGAGVSLAATSLAANTTYYVYAVAAEGAVNALEASTTAYETHTDGTAVKSGDPSRALVGMARTVTGPAWADTDARRFVISWFNRQRIKGQARFSTTRTTTSASYVELNTEIRVEFLCWAGALVDMAAIGTIFNSGSNLSQTSIGIDGTTPQDVFNVATGNFAIPVSVIHANTLAEGYHYATVLGRVWAGTGNWYTGIDSPGERFTLRIMTNG